MVLDSYTCELCLHQRVKTLRHLFLCCPLAKKLLVIHKGFGADMVESRMCNNLYEKGLLIHLLLWK
jgi:hypothetical protein